MPTEGIERCKNGSCQFQLVKLPHLETNLLQVVIEEMAKSEEILTGQVKWFSRTKRFGFIACDNGRPDLFVHTANVTNKSWWPEGKVQFRIGVDRNGREMAIDVAKLTPVRNNVNFTAWREPKVILSDESAEEKLKGIHKGKRPKPMFSGEKWKKRKSNSLVCGVVEGKIRRKVRLQAKIPNWLLEESRKVASRQHEIAVGWLKGKLEASKVMWPSMNKSRLQRTSKSLGSSEKEGESDSFMSVPTTDSSGSLVKKMAKMTLNSSCDQSSPAVTHMISAISSMSSSSAEIGVTEGLKAKNVPPKVPPKPVVTPVKAKIRIWEDYIAEYKAKHA